MRIQNVIWLDSIVEKLEEKHNVQVDEVLEVLENRPTFKFVSKGNRKGEDVYSAFGQTEAGRYLIVFFVYKPGSKALIISARDMTQAERRLHERQ